MKKTIIAASLLALSPLHASADAIGLYIGGSIWDQQASGVFGESSGQIDFNLEKEQQQSFYVAVEHPLPFIPNAKISSTSLETTGQATLTSSFDFDGNSYDTSTLLSANFDVSFVDYTIYYELFDNDLLSFDFGLTGRDFDGEVSVSGDINGTITSGSISTTDIVPMLYVRTNIGLPFTGYNLFAEGNFLSIDDHTLFDYQAGISYELVDNIAVDINLTLGYRVVKLELEDLNDLYSDIEFKGAFAGVVVHF